MTKCIGIDIVLSWNGAEQKYVNRNALYKDTTWTVDKILPYVEILAIHLNDFNDKFENNLTFFLYEIVHAYKWFFTKTL